VDDRLILECGAPEAAFLIAQQQPFDLLVLADMTIDA